MSNSCQSLLAANRTFRFQSLFLCSLFLVKLLDPAVQYLVLLEALVLLLLNELLDVGLVLFPIVVVCSVVVKKHM
jgi:hypothetical protein